MVTRTKEVEFILSYEKLFSVVVDAPVGEDGEVDWIEAEKLMYAEAPAQFRHFLFMQPEADMREDLLIQEANELSN